VRVCSEYTHKSKGEKDKEINKNKMKITENQEKEESFYLLKLTR